VVVVDNASTDNSYEAICRLFGTKQNVRIIRNNENLGYARGNNVGYNNSKGDIVVFLNVDTKVDQYWLSELVGALASSEEIGGVQSRLLRLRDMENVESEGRLVDWLGFAYMRYGSMGSMVYGGGLGGAWETDKVELFFADGACMAFKRTVLAEVCLDNEPFDPSYFFYFEDYDLGWRVRLRGYRIVLVPTSIVYHYRGGSGPDTLRYLSTLSFAKGRLSTLIKNYSLANLVRIMPIVAALEVARVMFCLPTYPYKSLAKLRALLWCLGNLRTIWKKRIFVQSRIRAVPDSRITTQMIRPNFSFLWRYYRGEWM
jgi:hypothetical protein